MPRKTKDQTVETAKEKKLKEPKKSSKTSSSKKKPATKKTTSKKAEEKKVTTKKATSKKAEEKKATTKKATSKKAETKKVTTKKATTSRTKKTSNKKVEILEYYDLPYRYNQTVVKILAQTPTTLFIYWDISDADRENFEKQYGKNFFETTKPILIVHNDTMNYSYEVEINDFANCWYLHVGDSKCDYRIELGRRPISYVENLNTDYIYVSSSNEIEIPNDKILFDINQKMIYYRNVKTGELICKPIFSLLKNMSKIYNIYDIYKAIYKNENVDEIYDLLNPSS